MGADGVMDVRTIPCSVKHGLIVQTCRDLPAGGSFILLNGHDPVPLREQLANHWPGAFAWEYLERGPEVFRLRISKLKDLPTDHVPAALNCGDH